MDTPTAQQLYLRRRRRLQRRSPSPATDHCPTSNCGTRSRRRCPPGFEAVDDEQIAAENQNQLQQALSFITTFLLVFAAVSLVVGTFLILNTFSIIVAQRTRELALFRALGASRRRSPARCWWRRWSSDWSAPRSGCCSVSALAARAEGAVRGDRHRPGRGRPGLPVANGGRRLRGRCAGDPARRVPAGPARPPGCRRSRRCATTSSIPESSMRRRLIGGAALTAVGAGADDVGAGLRRRPAAAGRRGAGGVHRGGAAQPGDRPADRRRHRRRRIPGLFGTVGVLARENSRRNPRRTAATASALMIGLALVTTMAVLGQSTKSSVDEMVSTDLKADYVVSNAVQAPFSPAIAAADRRRAGVATPVPFRFTVATIERPADRSSPPFDARRFSRVVAITVESGGLDTGDDGLLVTSTRAAAEGWKVGDTVTVGLPAGADGPDDRRDHRAQQVSRRGHRRFRSPRWRPAASHRSTPSSTSNAPPGADPAAVTAGDRRRAGRPADRDRARTGPRSPPTSGRRSTSCWASSTPCSGWP